MLSGNDTDEIRRQLHDLKLPVNVGQRKQVVERLLHDIQFSIRLFFEQVEAVSFRATHDELRRLWRLCDLAKPTAKTIRATAASLSETAFTEFSKRAQHIFPQIVNRPFSKETFEDWLSNAPKDQLVLVIRRCISGETVLVQPKPSADGHTPRPRREPRIMGYARRVESKSEIAAARAPTSNEEKKVPLNRFRHRGGYQEKDALDELVLNLALDFANATECRPLEHLKEFTAARAHS